MYRRQLITEASSLRDSTAKQQAQLTKNRNRLLRKIARIRTLQAKHNRTALQALALPLATSQLSELNAEDVPLIFPSDLPICNKNIKLQALESHLRDGQCQDSLDQLRNDLLVKSRLNTYKKANTRRQGPTTRTRDRMDRHE